MFKGRSKVDADRKLLSSLNLPPVLLQPVDAAKVNLGVMDKWIERELKRELGFEDDILVGMICNQLRDKPIDVKTMATELTMFIQQEAAMRFLSELWNLLLEAQCSPDGLPAVLVQEKVRELKAAAASQTQQQAPPKPLPPLPSKPRGRSRSPDTRPRRPRHRSRGRRSRSPASSRRHPR